MNTKNRSSRTGSVNGADWAGETNSAAEAALFVSDLDNTLIYSYRHDIGQHRRLVEVKEGKELSFMTLNSHQLLDIVREHYRFIPLTTRSLEQYQRICFFDGWTPEYALVTNGSLLLRNGVIDEQWRQESLALCKGAEEALCQSEALLQADHRVSLEVKRVDGFFVYTKSREPEETVAMLKEALTGKPVQVLRNGSKVYVLPEALSKGAAVERLRKLTKAPRIIAAGDSEFDISMLMAADEAWFPPELDSEELRGHPQKREKPEDRSLLFSDHLLTGLAKDIKR